MAVEEVSIDVVAVATGVERSGVGTRLVREAPWRFLVGLTGERVIMLEKNKEQKTEKKSYMIWNASVPWENAPL